MIEYNHWNIQQLLEAELKISAEIKSRITTILEMENAFLTYNPNGTADDYRVLIETGLDLVRKGIKEEG